MADLRRAGYAAATRLKLDGELDRWRRLGVRPRLWWRDDDARTPGSKLDRLLTLAAGRPLALAVIPDGDLKALAARLANEAGVCVGQHGVDHTNRRTDGTTPSEYGAPPSVAQIAWRVAAGRSRLAVAGLSPCFYTPPWNAVDPGLPQALSQLGVPILSAGQARTDEGELTYMSAEIDVLRWKGGARFKGAWRMASMLAQALKARRETGAFERPVGLLTHHLDHDEPSWRYLAWALPVFDRWFDWTPVTASQPVQAPMPREAGRNIGALARTQPVW